MVHTIDHPMPTAYADNISDHTILGILVAGEANALTKAAPWCCHSCGHPSGKQPYVVFMSAHHSADGGEPTALNERPRNNFAREANAPITSGPNTEKRLSNTTCPPHTNKPNFGAVAPLHVYFSLLTLLRCCQGG